MFFTFFLFLVFVFVLMFFLVLLSLFFLCCAYGERRRILMIPDLIFLDCSARDSRSDVQEHLVPF